MDGVFFISEEMLNSIVEKVADRVVEMTRKPTTDEVIEGVVNKSEKEAKKILGCSQTTLWRMRKQGKIHCTQIGSRVLYPLTELERVVREGV